MGGRTSCELEGGFQPFGESPRVEDESDPQFTDINFAEESTQDVPNKKNWVSNQSRKRGMVSPNLSPIFLRRRKCDDEEIFMEDENKTDVSEKVSTTLYEKKNEFK